MEKMGLLALVAYVSHTYMPIGVVAVVLQLDKVMLLVSLDHL